MTLRRVDLARAALDAGNPDRAGGRQAVARPKQYQVDQAVPDAGLASHQTLGAQHLQGRADGRRTAPELGARPGLRRQEFAGGNDLVRDPGPQLVGDQR
jgi:hypothetical protein